MFPDDAGGYRLVGRVEAEVGALLMRAIDAASDAGYRGSVPETTPEQRRADALALLAERAMAAGFGGSGGGEAGASAEAGREGEEAADDAAAEGASAEAPPTATGTRAERYLVLLHVDEGTITGHGDPGADDGTHPLHPHGGPHLEDGTRVATETTRRLACDASVVTVRRRGKETVVEGRTRTVPPRLRRALEIRDRGCRFPGCGCRFTDAHHIRPWWRGGPTRLDNLVLLCARHHHLLHEGGFRVEADPERPGQPVFYDPRGVRIPRVPPAMTLGAALPRKREGAMPGSGGAGLRWEEDVPLALYLRAMEAIG